MSLLRDIPVFVRTEDELAGHRIGTTDWENLDVLAAAVRDSYYGGETEYVVYTWQLTDAGAEIVLLKP